MKVLVKRDQYRGMLGMGKVKFELTVRAELTPEEKRNLEKYKLGRTVVYRKHVDPEGKTVIGRFFEKMSNKVFHYLTDVTIDTLIHGKTFVCKDVVKLLSEEDYVLQSFKVTRDVIEAASTFGGEQVVEF